jgi:SHS2 domain-containing protein
VFEFLDHTADTAVRLTAGDAAGLVQSAVDALRCIYLGEEAGAELAKRVDSGRIDPGTAACFPIALEAEDGEAVLIELLAELIFLFDTERFLCARVEIESVSLDSPASLRGTLVGTTGVADLELQTEVKAATYHGVRIRREGGRLTVDVVFDL